MQSSVFGLVVEIYLENEKSELIRHKFFGSFKKEVEKAGEIHSEYWHEFI